MRQVLTTATALALVASAAGAGVSEDLAALAAVRDRLLAAFEARVRADAAVEPGADLFLVFGEGADEEEVRMTLRRRGGRWHPARAVVPYWRQETQKEKFSYLHRSGVQSTDRDKIVHPVDPTGLELDGGRVGGTFEAVFRIDWLRDERMKPGGKHLMTVDGRWSLLDKWRIVDHRKERRQQFRLDARVRPDVRRVELDLADAIDGKPARLVFRLPRRAWDRPRVLAPTWNASVHDLDVSDLALDGERLTGTLRIRWVPDPWYPRRVQHVAYTIDAAVDGRGVSGTFKATVTATEDIKVIGQSKGRNVREGPAEWTGSINGRVLRAVEGMYRASGEMGTYAGRVEGGLAAAEDDGASLLAPPADAESAELAAAVYARVRALEVALAHYPYPLRRALARATLPAPEWPAEQADARDAWIGRVREAAERAEATVPEVERGRSRPADPHFGPYYALRALPSADEAPNRVPGETGRPGPQRWQYVDGWRVLGPLPQPAGFDPGPGNVPDLVPAFGAAYAAGAETPLVWQRVETEEGTIRGPGQGDALWYAAAEVASDAAREVWLGLDAADYAVLWVNGRPVWMDEEREWGHHRCGPAVVKVSLAKGVNRLLIRCRDDRGESSLRVTMCTRGRPLAGVPPDAEAPAADSLPPIDPEADPPLAWDLEAGTNVLWRASMHVAARRVESSISSSGMTVTVPSRTPPVAVAGDRLFVCAAPHTLLCLDAATGRELWRRETNVLELSDEVAFEAWQKADAKARLQVFRDLGFIGAKEDGYGRIRSAGPVTDGRHVWVAHGTGAAACYDVAGERKWILATGMADVVLGRVGDRLILEGAPPRGGGRCFGLAFAKKSDGHPVVALDAVSSEVRWARTAEGRFVGGAYCLRLAGPAGPRDLLVTRSGEVIDAAGGETIPPRLDLGPWDWAGVDVRGDTLYSTFEGGRAAARVWIDADGQVGHRLLWRGQRLHAFAAGGPGSTLAADRLVYTTRLAPEHAKHCPASVVSLDFFDPATGATVGWMNPVLRGGNVHTQPVRAGAYLFVADGRGGAHTGGTPEEREVVVLRAGPEPYLVSRNPAPRIQGPLVFDGDRMYMCRGDEIVCIAARTREGRAWQDERVARTVLAGMVPEPPEPPPALPPLADAPDEATPVVPLEPGETITGWLVAGPFPQDAPADAPPLSGEPLPKAGTKLDVAGTARRWVPLEPKHVTSLTSFRNDGRLDDWQLRTTVRRIDAEALLDGQDRGVLYFFTVLANGRDRLVYSTMPRPAVEAWIGGKAMAPGEPVRLEPGRYPLLVRVQPDLSGRRDVQLPVDVAAARAAGVLADVGWPKVWHCLGPMPQAGARIEGDALRRVPTAEETEVGDSAVPCVRLAAEGPTLDLAPLVASAPGQKVTRVPQDRVAYCFGEITCPADGRLIVNAAADWFMAWYVDGKLVYDTLKAGNAKAPTMVTAHTFGVDLAAGRHVLAVRVRPGSKGWSLTSVGGLATGPVGDLPKRFPASGGVMASAPQFHLSPALAEAKHPAKVRRTWLEQIRARRDRIGWIVRALPETDLAARARALLAAQEAE